MRSALVPILLADPLPWAKKADYAWDFLRDRARFAGGYKGALANTPGWSFTRASTGYAQTSAGVLTAFASGELRRTDKGVLIEGARTNKCTNYNANPTDLTNVTKSGDAAATLTVVDDTAALAAAGLSQICTSGKVYKLDNSAGTGAANANISGTSGNTNAHAISIFWRGTGDANLGTAGTGVSASQALTATFARYVSSVTTPSSSGDTMRVRAQAGAVLYFVLNQFEEGAFVSSPIVVAGASATRAADSLTVTGVSGLDYPLTLYAEFEIALPSGASLTGLQNGVLDVDTGGIADGSAIYTSSSSYVALNRIANVNNAVVSGGAAVAGTPRKLAGSFATNDARGAYNGTLFSPDTSLTVSTPSRISFGAQLVGNSLCYLRRAAIYSRALTDAELQAVTT